MERQTIFRNRQGVLPEDFNNPQTFMRDSLDHVVKDGIQDAKSWSDFQVIQSGTAEVTAKPGRIYSAGAVYVAENDNVFDLLSSLPATNKKWVAIVAWGQEIETNTQPRNFLIDVTTRTTEPDSVPMQKLRMANVATVVGIEAPQPAKPAIDSGNVIIAWVMIGPTGVESISLNEAARLPQVAREKVRTDSLEAWRAIIGPRVDSLASDLARLFAMLQGMGSSRLIEQVAVDVARLKEANELEDNYSDYGADRFLDTAESETTDVNFLAKVQEGVRFSDEAANIAALQVFNPVNPDVTISNGFLLPKYADNMRFKVEPFLEELSISQYQYQTHEMVQRTVARTRIRYGEELTICTNNAWFRSGRWDSAQNVLYKDGDTWEVIDGNGNINHTMVRLRRFWVDSYNEYYWDRITIDHTINGQQIGETFLNPADGWLSAIGLYFTQKGATGNVDVALTQVVYGQPDLENVLNKVTLNVADILTSSDGSIETKVPFPATFLEAGKRYAIVLTTAGNHYVAMAAGTQYAQGTFFYSVDGAYQQGVVNKDLMFSLYFAKFNRTRSVIDLQPLSLSGGITDIDILAPMITPASCQLQFEVQVAGVWSPLSEVVSGNTVLYGLPPLLPFRAIFNGTLDVQAGINLVDSVLSYSRPRTTLKHISKLVTLGAATQSLKVVAILENYKEANHDFDIKIQIAGAGAEVAAASIVDVELDPPVDARSAAHKRIRRTFTWTNVQIPAPMTTLKIVANATTTSALDTFHLAERVHLSF
ncbi:MAG: hypothetical protein ACK4TP_11195 [Hyphomicrobium sp.]